MPDTGERAEQAIDSASELEREPATAEPATAEPATAEPPTPVACVALERPVGTLEFVRQQRADLPDRFDPNGRFAADDMVPLIHPLAAAFAASDASPDCHVWTLDREVHLGRFGSPRDSGDCVRWPGGEDPCATWPELVELDVDHAVGPLHERIVVDAHELVIENELVRASVDGVERYRFSADEPYLAVSISPARARLARFALARPHAIELRELDRGTLLAELSLDQPTPPGLELQRLALTWSNNMPIALIGREAACPPEVDYCKWDWGDDESVWELRRWAHPSAAVQAELVTWEGDDTPASIMAAYAGPLGRWLWIQIDAGYGHDNPWELRQIPLTPEAEQLHADFYEKGIDGEPDPGIGNFGLDDDIGLDGSWLTGPRTARVWTFTHSEYDGEGNGSDELGWLSLQLWPSPVRSGPHELASDYSVEQQDVTVLGVADEHGLVAWSHCWPNQDLEWLTQDQELDDVGPDLCRGNRPVPPSCEPRGISDRLDWLLVACGPTWRLVPIGPAAAALEPVELATHEDGPVTATFGRSGLALAGERSGLRLLHSDGRLRASFPEVTALLPATLGPELDRVVGRSPTGLDVFDLATGERTASITLDTATPTITQLAFAPDGKRLATSDDRRIEIHDLVTGTATGWDAKTVRGLAWRQDGAVLFSGAERPLPERAWDPVAGKLAPVQPDPVFLDRLAAADLDPSWRWAFEGNDVILRTLDGLALYLEHDGWVVTETGLYDGVGQPRHLFVRIIGDDQPRVLDLASLPERLRHPGLLEQFVAGVALPAPQLDGAELGSLGKL